MKIRFKGGDRMQSDNMLHDEDGRIQMHRIHKYPPRSEDGAYIIESRKNKQTNYLWNALDAFDDNSSAPELIHNDNKAEPKKSKGKHKNKSKKPKKRDYKPISILKSPQKIKSMPFYPDKSINRAVKARFDILKIKNALANDMQFVDKFIGVYGGFVLYNTDDGSYYWYTGKCWKPDNDCKIYNFVVKVIYEINRAIKKSSGEQAKKQGNLYCNNHFIKGILEMLKTRCVCHSDDFDKHPYLLNVRNGTVNLVTKKLQKHNPEDMLTQFIDIDYNPDATGDRFQEFILEICNDDKELANYLQSVYGYAITGETREQRLFMEIGFGANGKSTLNEVVFIVAANYAERVDFSLFQKKLSSSVNSPTPELAKLKGKRIVLCSETDNNQLNEAKIKEITGGTKITARALYGTPFSYTPEFTVILDGNQLPTIKGTDYGIWRRIVVIPFQRKFDKDVTLKDNLLKEKEAILKWLIDGAYKYYNEGLPKCKAVKKATAEYQAEENTVDAFIKYSIIEKADSKYSAKALYDAYAQYCANCCSTPVNIKDFKAAMAMEGYKNKRTNKGMVWMGICLRDNMD